MRGVHVRVRVFVCLFGCVCVFVLCVRTHVASYSFLFQLLMFEEIMFQGFTFFVSGVMFPFLGYMGSGRPGVYIYIYSVTHSFICSHHMLTTR